MSAHASHGVHEIHYPMIVRLCIQVVEDVYGRICGIVVNCYTWSIFIQLFVRKVLAIRKFRSNFAVRVDPLCFDTCSIGDMFKHLRTFVFITYLSHEETDLVERMRYFIAQLIDEEWLARLGRSNDECELIEECVLIIEFPVEFHNAHTFLVLSKILQLFVNGLFWLNIVG